MSGQQASTMDAGAPRSGKAPVLAIASLVAITAIVAVVVARYPRTASAPARLATERAQPALPAARLATERAQPLLPGRGPAQVRLLGQGHDGPAAEVQGQGGAALAQQPKEPVPGNEGAAQQSPEGALPSQPPGRATEPKPLPPRTQPRSPEPSSKLAGPSPDIAKPSPQPPARGGKRPTKDDIIDVFGGAAP